MWSNSLLICGVHFHFQNNPFRFSLGPCHIYKLIGAFLSCKRTEGKTHAQAKAKKASSPLFYGCASLYDSVRVWWRQIVKLKLCPDRTFNSPLLSGEQSIFFQLGIYNWTYTYVGNLLALVVYNLNGKKIISEKEDIMGTICWLPNITAWST